MEHDSESNKVIEQSDKEEYEFSFNFINLPWDDRSKNSKIGIISLLVAIFVATLALVINNLVFYYKRFDARSIYSNIEMDCNMVKADEHPYAARIHSISSNELICIGAVVSISSVLANEVCLKSGPIQLKLGNPTNPRCKKGFSIDAVDLIPHEGVITKSLVLLSTLDYISDCIKTIKIGAKVNADKQLYIIGRPYRGGKSFSFQLAKYNNNNNFTSFEELRTLNKNKTICVDTFGKCPVRAGDLLVQKGLLLGLASTSVNRREESKTACFANLSVVYSELKALDIKFDNKI
ncbi:unnamed protein product, partial [Brenthis ino]